MTRWKNLSPREGEVALLVARGLSNKEVAYVGNKRWNREDSHAQHFPEVGHKEPRRTGGFTGRGLVELELYFYHVWRETHAVSFAKLPESLAFNFSSLLCFYPRTPCE